MLQARKTSKQPRKPTSDPWGRRLLRRLVRGIRNTLVVLILLSVVIGVKALQNRRDVVEPAPLETYVAVWQTAGLGDFRIADPYDVPGQWYKAQFHTHTDKSIDGRWSVEESLAAYAEAGYGFVAIADHDKITRPDNVPDGLIAVPAEENTVSFPFWPLGQHVIYLFADDHVKRGSAVERFEQMRARGGIISVAHPHWPGNLGSGRWELRHLMAAPQFTLMEVFNPHSAYELDVQIWHEVLVRRGPNAPVWAVAVDDAHDLQLFNSGWTMVKVSEHSLAALRTALEQGSLYATTGPIVSFGTVDGAIVVAASDEDLVGADHGVDHGVGFGVDHNADRGSVSTADQVYEVRFINAGGEVVHEHTGPLPAMYIPKGTEGFVRIEVRALSGRGRAWSQPFWIVPTDEGSVQ